MKANRKADRTESRLLRALLGRVERYMARAGLIAFAVEGGAPDAGGTHLGGDAPAGDKPAGDAPAGDKPTGDAPAGDKPAADVKPEGDKPAGGEKPKEGDKPAGAPEAYEFKAPEGAELNPETVSEFSALAKELNLPQAEAQKVLDFGMKVQQDTIAQVQARMTESVEAQGEAWGNESKADKEFGGDKFDENLAVAQKALDQFGSPELKTMLVQSKLGNHPEVLRAFVRIGQAISQDGFVPGRAGGGGKTAQSMYANSNMNP